LKNILSGKSEKQPIFVQYGSTSQSQILQLPFAGDAVFGDTVPTARADYLRTIEV
jgi:hypothetical protein